MMVAPGTPRALVQRLNREFNALLQQPEVKNRMESSGLQITGGPPEDFAAILKRDYEKYGAALRAAGVKPE
jgi:tripartite-type tricarboxylate transporter receptor subunit TctC